MKIKYAAKVISVTEKRDKVYSHGVGEAAVFTDVSRGWFVGFEDSYESLFVGMEKPVVKVGDIATIEITFP